MYQSPGKQMPEQCTVAQLRDMVLARGEPVSMNKLELVQTVAQYYFLEQQVAKTYVDRSPDPNGRLYSTIETSSTRTIRAIITKFN